MANLISVEMSGPASKQEVPDGEYAGVWSGHQVTAVCGYRKFVFATDEAVRGIGIGCVVTAKSGKITVRTHHPELGSASK
jgi:hypothetical protein